MPKTIELHCTTCPNDCALSVFVEEENGALRVTDVKGNRCPRSVAFAKQEVTRPVRVLATTVCVEGGDEQLLPVRTSDAIPFDLHFKAMDQLRCASVKAPVHMGDVIIPNLANSGVDLVASMDVAANS